MALIDPELLAIDTLMSTYPKLSNEENKALARDARAGNMQAREKLILHNVRLAVSEARKCTNPLTYADGAQSAIEGLVKAVDKYDVELGYNFSTYAIWWVRQSLRMWLFQRNRIYLPRHNHDRMIKVKKYSSDGERSPEEIAARSGLSLQHVMDAQSYLGFHYLSLDAPIPLDQDSPETLSDLLPDEGDEYAALDDREEAHYLAHRYLSALPEREAQIIRWFFGLDCQRQTVAEMSVVLGISVQRVRQLYNQAIKRMQTLPVEVSA